MKRILLLVLLAIVSTQAFAQEIIYGSVRTDGYEKISEGALWSKRPEAKMIYGGSYPPGYTVYTLDQDYYVRFIDTEHNSLDANYIVFPKGSLVYKDNETGKYFAAKCGNEIEYLRPVNQVKVVERTVEKEPEMIPIDDPNNDAEAQKVEIEVTVNQSPYEYWDDSYRYYSQRMTPAGMYVYDTFEYLIYRANQWYRVPYDRYVSWGGQRVHRYCGYRPHTYNPPHRRPRPSTGGPGGSPRHKDPENGGPGGAGTHGGPGGAITHGGPIGAGMSRSAVTETRRAERSYEASRNYSRSERAYQGSSYSGSSRSGAFSGYTRNTPQRSISYQRSSNTPSSFGRGGHPAQRSSSRSSGGGSAFRR